MKKWFLLLALLAGTKLCAQIPTLDQKCVATTGANQTFCTVSGVAANDAIVVHLYFGTGQTLSSLQDCTGSSACSSSTDTLAPSVSCVVLLSTKVCEYYICNSALSGTMSVTSNFTGSLGTNYVEVSTWKGMLPSGCLDQTGTGTAGTASAFTASTSGNVVYKGELVIGFIQTGTAPVAGTGFTQIQISGNLQSEYANSSPTVGGPATASWTFPSNSGSRGIVSSWKGGIFFDAKSNSGNCGNVANCTWSHTVSTTAPNEFLWVVIGLNTGAAGATISSVTYAGASLSLAAAQTEASSTIRVFTYYLPAPATGTNNIVVTLSVAVGTTNGFFAEGASFSGVAQTTPFDAATKTVSQATLGSITNTITVITPGAYLLDGTAFNNTGGNLPTPNSPQVLLFSQINTFGASYSGPIVSAGSVSDAWTCTGTSTNWGLITALLKPASSVAVGTAQNMMPLVI